MTLPASSARALYEIIREVNDRIGNPDNSAYHAWHSVAGGLEFGSSDFAQFHAEVVELCSEVAEMVRTLSPTQQERYRQYLPSWWDALVQPRVDWAQEQKKIISDPSLHMLAALADVEEVRASFAPSNPQTVDVLQKAVLFLVEEVRDATEIPQMLRDQIVSDLKHVLWLLNRADVFGVDHSVAAMERVTGKVIAATAKSPSKSLKKMAVGLTAALAMVATNTSSLETIVGNVQNIFGISAEPAGQNGDGDIVQSTVVQVYAVCTTQELPPGTSTGDNDAIEGELVEDGEAG